MYKPESVQEKETHINSLWLWDKNDHSIPAKRLDEVLISKKKKKSGFCCSRG